ncbi:pyridoxamine 5'-phosphate oxidase [Pseudonocardia sulfidoxydans NBRC 16205]|uniref:Pyridoxamine 5'-phosphate oxidase n=1 Tax=Pseudonocardia sulfidoxydans NBRC 16205 TaxID=1223511 RepID=A0A511DI17_9PSEU|nr:pyridoxamine 5'-phosphate oxidase family protein [Pseudonocardia sulfidoxydans]GEL24445.1 pyridoxamine 5'-phosphate oxidase [Pseudonocardia sulfidoxydans NBRC 16205]
MTSWSDVEQAEPEFAAKARRILTAYKHLTLATVRADGSPRISGIEIRITDGELTFGSMPDARKGADLLRDPRFALHSATVDPPDDAPAQWPGEVKVAGRARCTGDLTGAVEGLAFTADLHEVVHTHLNEAGDRLVVEFWHPGKGLRRVERE